MTEKHVVEAKQEIKPKHPGYESIDLFQKKNTEQKTKVNFLRTKS